MALSIALEPNTARTHEGKSSSEEALAGAYGYIGAMQIKA